MIRLTRDGTAEPVARDQILRRERGRGKYIHFSCSTDHEQDWQPYPVDSCSCYMCDHAYMVWKSIRVIVDHTHLRMFSADEISWWVAEYFTSKSGYRLDVGYIA